MHSQEFTADSLTIPRSCYWKTNKQQPQQNKNNHNSFSTVLKLGWQVSADVLHLIFTKHDNHYSVFFLPNDNINQSINQENRFCQGNLSKQATFLGLFSVACHELPTYIPEACRLRRPCFYFNFLYVQFFLYAMTVWFAGILILEDFSKTGVHRWPNDCNVPLLYDCSFLHCCTSQVVWGVYADMQHLVSHLTALC